MFFLFHDFVSYALALMTTSQSLQRPRAQYAKLINEKRGVFLTKVKRLTRQDSEKSVAADHTHAEKRWFGGRRVFLTIRRTIATYAVKLSAL